MNTNDRSHKAHWKTRERFHRASTRYPQARRARWGLSVCGSAELVDAEGQARDAAACVILVNNTLRRDAVDDADRAVQLHLSGLYITVGDSHANLLHSRTQRRAPVAVAEVTDLILTDALDCGFVIRHDSYLFTGAQWSITLCNLGWGGGWIHGPPHPVNATSHIYAILRASLESLCVLKSSRSATNSSMGAPAT